MIWKSLPNEPPTPLKVFGRQVLLRRYRRDGRTTPYPNCDYKILDTTIERAVSKGWNEWMEIPE